MDPSGRRIPATAGIQIIMDDPAWRRSVRNAEAMVARAARLAGITGTVLLASDAAMKRLNARHRGRNQPTNVLTFAPAAPGLGGEIVLAFGTVRREAARAGHLPVHHMAHLVVHGGLHLQGHDHHGAGEARRMEMAEARILRRLGVANPWRRA